MTPVHIGGLAGLKLLVPGRVVTLKLTVHQLLEDHTDITDQRNGGAQILADFRRIHINMDDGGGPALQLVRLDHGPVRHTGADQHEDITLTDGIVGMGLAVGAQHTQIEGIRIRHGPDTHHGRDHRDLMEVREGLDQMLTLRQDGAAAHTDQRFFRVL